MSDRADSVERVGGDGSGIGNGNVEDGARSFLGSVLALAGGSAIAQVVVVLSSPIKLRLFAPDALGVAALFLSVVSIVSLAGCFMYYLAIALPRRDPDAANLLGLCCLLTAAVSAVFALLIAAAGSSVLELLKLGDLEPYKWLTPAGVFLVSISLPLTYWHIRRRQFKRVAAFQVVVSLVATLGAVGVGLLGFTSGRHLVLVRIAALTLGALVLACALGGAGARFVLKSCTVQGMLGVARRYRKFPLVVSWSALINEGSRHVPTLILASCFGATVTGLYALAQGLILLPSGLLAGSVADVFLQRAGSARSEPAELAGLLEGVCTRLITTGLLPAVVLAVAGPSIIGFVFGERWTEAGVYASILSLALFGGFVGAPVGRLFVVLERQGIILALSSVTLVSRVGALAVGGLVLESSRLALLLFSGVGLFLGLAQVAICVRLTKADGWVLLRHFARQLAHAAPCAIIVLGVDWGLDLGGAYILAASAVGALVYALLVFRSDEQLRQVLMSALRCGPSMRA